MNNENEVQWFLAEVTKDCTTKKYHIIHPICRMYDIVDGIDYIWRNPILLEENRKIAIIKGNGEIWAYCKDCGFSNHYIFLTLDDYDNIEVLYHLCDDPLYDRYGKIHYKYE